MEGHANSVEDRLIDGLSFKLAPGASYVQVEVTHIQALELN